MNQCNTRLLWLLALLAVSSLFQGSSGLPGGPNATEIECDDEDNCSSCYITLVKYVMYYDKNVYNLSRAFFPPTEEPPVFVIVNYNFEDGRSYRWYWTVQSSTLLHPLEGFQFFSLFFGDFSSLAKTVDLTLPNECYNGSEGYFELLTQRLKVHASTQRVSPRFRDQDDANSANLITLHQKIHSNTILIVILYLFQIVVPIFLTSAIGFIVFSMNKRISTFLPSTQDDQSAIALSVVTISILLFLFAICMDITGIVFAILRVNENLEYAMYIQGENGINALFILPMFLLLFYDLLGFLIVIRLIPVYMCWQCGRSECFCRKYHLPGSLNWQYTHIIAAAITAIAFVFSNHSYYIIIGLINDSIHGHSIGIYYITTLVVYLLCFKIFWKIILQTQKKGIRYIYCTKDYGCIKSLLVIIFIALLIPFQILATAAFVYLPIKGAVEDVATQINAIYQSLIVLFTALITYKLFVHPKTNEEHNDEVWIAVGDKQLMKKDRKNIERGYHLNNCIIHAAMLLLKKQRPRLKGFEDPSTLHLQTGVLFQGTSYGMFTAGKGIQIMKVNNQNHWITLHCCFTADSTQALTVIPARASVTLYDTLPTSDEPMAKSKSLVHQLMSDSQDYDLVEKPVQDKVKQSDSGVLAIAIATELALKPQEKSSFKFDLKTMRGHLVDCFEECEMKPFPKLLS